MLKISRNLSWVVGPIPKHEECEVNWLDDFLPVGIGTSDLGKIAIDTF
jgi:hypothetical protein